MVKRGEKIMRDCTRFWCQKVLPLVYDDSLSYYEVLCKLADSMKKIVEKVDLQDEEIESIKNSLSEVEKWIADFDTSFVKNLINEYLEKVVKQVYFGISNSGYFVAYIPSSWDEISFDTIQEGGLYGHLTLSY